MTGQHITAAVSITGTIPQLPAYLRKPLRRSDQFIQLAAAAAHQALAQVPAIDLPGERCGLFVGTSFGPMQSNFDVLDALVDGDPVSPTLFSHSVFNAAAGYVSRLFGVFGGAWTLASFSWPFYRCLQNAQLMLASGRLDRVLVLQVETYSALLQDARKLLPGTAPQTFPPGAVGWVLEQNAPPRASVSLTAVQIDEQPAPPSVFLDRRENLPGQESTCFHGPAGYPARVNQAGRRSCLGGTEYNQGDSPVRWCCPHLPG